MSAEQRTTLSRNRGDDFAGLSNLLRGDLDWIVMKCLEKDRSRRYETANGLSHDIQRHLGNEPVIARPPSAAYRFQKMVRRNKGAALAGTAVVLTLLFALGLSTRALMRERKARLATMVAEQQRENARHVADTESIRASTVVDFVTNLFDGIFPDLDLRGHQDAIKRILQTADLLAQKLTNAPLAEAQLRSHIGFGYLCILHEFVPAIPHYESVNNSGSRLGPAGERLALDARAWLTSGKMWMNLDTNAAELLLRIGVEASGLKPPDVTVAAWARAEAAAFYSWNGSDEVAAALANEALKIDPRWRAGGGGLETLLRLQSRVGDKASAEAAADRLLASHLQLLSDVNSSAKSLSQLLFSLRDGDPFIIPKNSLERALRHVPSSERLWRDHLQTLLGASMAREGNWIDGLRMMAAGITNSVYNVRVWSASMHLAALTDQQETRRFLALAGLALYGGGAGAETSRVLAETFLIIPPDEAMSPIIDQFIKRASEGPLYTRAASKLLVALRHYHHGEYESVADAADAFLHDGIEANGLKFVQWRAPAYFLKSMAASRRRDFSAAKLLYEEGRRFHSPSLEAPGKEYVGDLDWGSACGNELLRREAATLLTRFAAR